MKNVLISTGLLIVMSTGCASEEAWVKRRDAIRQHAAERAAAQNATDPVKAAPENAEASKPQPTQG